MKSNFVILMLAFAQFGLTGAQAEQTVLTADPTLAIPKVEFDAKGDLKIIASSTSSQSDFDFLVGKWKMHNRRLSKRLEGNNDWTEFDSYDENSKILSGTADIDTYSTTEMPGMEGKHFEGLTLRLFNPKTRLWSLYWVASNIGVLDPPVVGSFENGVGHFFAKDTFKGKPIIMMSVGTPGTRIARFGVRRFLRTTARPGSGIGSMYQNESNKK